MVKVAMIGLGGMGNYHADFLSKLPNVRIVGVCDLVEEKARKLSEKLGGVSWTLDYHDLLDSCEAVWVCTEPFNRLDIVTTAAKEGKHLFTEKPIARSLKDADKMINAARKAGVKYMLGYCLRFWNPYKYMHDSLVGGELGNLVNCYTRRYMPVDMSHCWYGWQEKSGGATLDFASHDVNWLRWMGGDVATVFAKTYTVRATMHAEEHVQAMFIFKNGGMGTHDNSWSSWVGESAVGVIGTKGGIAVDRSGQVRKFLAAEGKETNVDIEAAIAIDPSGNVGKKDASGKIQKVTPKNETIQEHFFRCIEEDLEPITPAADGRKTLEIVHAIWKSTKTGKAVNLK